MTRYVRIMTEPGEERFREDARIAVRTACPYLSVRECGEANFSEDCFDLSRRQYDAGEMLEMLTKSGMPDMPDAVTLYLTDKDLYYPGFQYLYGAALPGRALVSEARLARGEDREKEVLHELGHALGLSHCANACVMAPSVSPAALRKKSGGFCPECSRKLRERIIPG